MCEENHHEVKSEISSFFLRDADSKPVLNEKYVVSKFEYCLPFEKNSNLKFKIEKDKDGDYILQRRNIECFKSNVIVLEHSASTQIKFVGLQIWRAALFLSDFIIDNQNLFKGKSILELGSGIGLTSIVAAMFAKQVISTDLDIGDILKLLHSNVEKNKKILVGEVIIKEINFFNLDWSVDLHEKIKNVHIILASDVIYDNDITEAFIATISKILNYPPKKTLYLALEKRYVFTLSDLDAVAPCYEHFISCLKSERLKSSFQWRILKLSHDFPQYFSYERTKELVLLEITSV